MRCRHGVTGPCAQCRVLSVRAEILDEVAKLVLELAESRGLDTSRLRALLEGL